MAFERLKVITNKNVKSTMIHGHVTSCLKVIFKRYDFLLKPFQLEAK
jgi:hypothetical protein